MVRSHTTVPASAPVPHQPQRSSRTMYWQRSTGLLALKQQQAQRPHQFVPVSGFTSRRCMPPLILKRRRLQTRLTRALHPALDTTSVALAANR